ncbi:MAG TPA: organomercurial lyase, partial [Actinomycetota bacterium]|nr:organomercurial lyase [Actinomycetota bacterium]
MLEELVDRLDLERSEVTAALHRLHDDDVIALQPGTDLIWLAHPFSALDAPFVVTSGGRTWDAICIWDAFGILAILEKDGSIVARCPDCAAGLHLEVTDGTVDPSSEMVVHFGVPAARWYEDIGHT